MPIVPGGNAFLASALPGLEVVVGERDAVLFLL